MERKKLALWMIGTGSLLLFALLIFIIIIHITRMNSANTTASSSQNSATWAPMPAGVVVPNEGDSSTIADVAVPSQQVPAAPDSPASFRNFTINIKANAYAPNTVIVNQGDTVNLEITAVDGNYGFDQPDYGLSSGSGGIKKGQTKRIQFQALNAGKFTFYCATCGGPAKGPVGYIIVTGS